MALVREGYVFDGHAACLHRLHDLLGFDHGHVGVVGAVLHHQRCLDAVERVDGRKPRQQIRLFDGVAVLDGRDGAHPRLALREERRKVDDTVEIDSSCEQLGILSEADHRHITPVRAAHDAQPPGAREPFSLPPSVSRRTPVPSDRAS
jgi:hypothetical protein